MATILLIDEQPIVRLGIRKLLESESALTVTGEAGSRREAMAHLLNGSLPDLVILDLALGLEDGLELLKELSALYPDMRLLVVTDRPPHLFLHRVKRAGAHGFLTKRDTAGNLVHVATALLSGETVFYRPTSGAVPTSLPLSSLSDRELHVFRMVGLGVSNKILAESMGLSPKTIETYKENLKRKLSLENTTELRHAAGRWIEQASSR